MVPVPSADRFDAFRALADRGRPGGWLMESLARTRAGTADSPETWAPAVADGVGLPAAAALGPTEYYADLAAPHGRRHVRVCAATAGDGVRALANLAILRGAVGTGRGYGVNPLRGQNNVQGASDMGALPDTLPGYGKVTDPVARSRAEEVWGVRVPAGPGLRIPQMFAAARAGDLRALWVIGEDVCATDPDTNRVAAALRACPLVICNELFLSETARHADVVLPVASWLEKEGTFVNFDRRFQRVRAAVAPPGEARTDFEAVHAVAAAMGVDLGCPTPAAALDGCGRLAPVFAGLSHGRLDREGAIPWPCPDADQPGEATLYTGRFATADGRAHLASCPYLPPGERADDDYPLIMVTGRRLTHYNSGSMTRRTANLLLESADWLDLHPEDADRYGLREGEPVTVESRHGEARLLARVSGEVNPGQGLLRVPLPGERSEPADLGSSGHGHFLPRVQGHRRTGDSAPRTA
ncbi:molybdopterin-dependent oxidoreductase [Streptomyces sp. NEAU-S7GS2]|uniref:molybdopterin oxidoreductase family protein n=1 Tax=Streptomyces sp. NEAU-S7GS2 TaxID=2202000 RepID=UPI001EF51AF9|nr:molybdopterin-dependent oxidoreductase [Streptomyces sp. NEAU-S7GS2]